MDQDRLDKLIKKQVEDLKTPTDPDLLWQKIQAKQAEEKKPKRRFFFFWLFGGALLLGGLALLYVIGFPNSESVLANKISTENKKEITANSSVNKTTKTKTKIDQKNTEGTDQLVGDLSAQPSPTLNSIKHDKKTRKSTIQLPTKSVNSNEAIPTTELINSTKSFKTITLKPTQSTTVNADFDKTNIAQNQPAIQPPSNTIQTIKKKETQVTNQEEIDANITVPTIDSTDYYAIKKATKTNKELPQVTLNNNEAKQEFKNELKPNTAPNLVLNNPTIDSSSVDSLEQLNKQPDALGSENQDNIPEKKWAFSSGASFVYGRGLRTLSNRNSEPANYVETRNDTETTLDAVRGKIDFRLENRSGFYLQSGLEYEQINERFDYYRERDIVEPLDDQLLAIIFAMDGSTSESRGVKEVELTSWLRKKTFNHYKRIDVPFLLGYHATKKDKRLGWFVEGGFSMNIWFKTTGEILDLNDELLDFENQRDLFKKRTGINLLGSAGVTYRITNKISLWASPEVKYNLNSITSDQHVLNQKYVNLGMGLGIRYHWL